MGDQLTNESQQKITNWITVTEIKSEATKTNEPDTLMEKPKKSVQKKITEWLDTEDKTVEEVNRYPLSSRMITHNYNLRSRMINHGYPLRYFDVDESMKAEEKTLDDLIVGEEDIEVKDNESSKKITHNNIMTTLGLKFLIEDELDESTILNAQIEGDKIIYTMVKGMEENSKIEGTKVETTTVEEVNSYPLSSRMITHSYNLRSKMITHRYPLRYFNVDKDMEVEEKTLDNSMVEEKIVELTDPMVEVKEEESKNKEIKIEEIKVEDKIVEEMNTSPMRSKKITHNYNLRPKIISQYYPLRFVIENTKVEDEKLDDNKTDDIKLMEHMEVVEEAKVEEQSEDLKVDEKVVEEIKLYSTVVKNVKVDVNASAETKTEESGVDGSWDEQISVEEAKVEETSEDLKVNEKVIEEIKVDRTVVEDVKVDVNETVETKTEESGMEDSWVWVDILIKNEEKEEESKIDESKVEDKIAEETNRSPLSSRMITHSYNLRSRMTTHRYLLRA